MSKERLRVLDRSVPVDIVDLFDGRSLEEVVIELNTMSGAYEREIMSLGRDVKFSADYYGYDGGIELRLDVMRDENDTEYNTRMTALERTKEKKRIAIEKKKEKARALLAETEAAERAEYERLRAKYGQQA